MQKILMIAFHYPPYEGGSGVHRTLKFSRYLPESGWQPIVVSADPRAFPKVGTQQLAEVPPSTIVHRAFALDTARHLAVCGRYSRVMALPDQWISWWFAAVCSGLRLIRKHRPAVIWSTYPIATAQLIGFTLHRLTGLPWVADFRDSMTEENYPRDPWARRSYLWIEKQVVKYASCLVFTAPSTLKMYHQRYPKLTADRCLLIANGYDEADFVGLGGSSAPSGRAERPLRILHAGLIYPDDRDPRAFFNALSRLKAQGAIGATDLNIDLRASGSENYYSDLIAQLNIADIIRLLPAISHREALEDCAAADALLLFQAASCNHQIPAKAYEYLRLGKPILALTPHEGDTAALLREAGGATVADLADEQSLMAVLPQFIASVLQGTHALPDLAITRRYARSWQAGDLADCLNRLIDNSAT